MAKQADSNGPPAHTGPDDDDGPEPFASPALYLPPLSPNESPESAPAPAPDERGPRHWWHWWYLVAAAVLVVAIVATLLLRPSGSRPDAITVPTEIPVSQLRVGDCLNPVPYGKTVTTATVVPCSQYHGGEVVGTVRVADGEFSDGQISAEVATTCSAKAEPYVRKLAALAGAGSAHSTYMYPSQESFKHGDRQGLCIVYALGGSIPSPLVESTAD